MAQVVKCLTLNLGSGNDLTVHEIEPHIELHTVGAGPILDSLSPSLSAHPPTASALYLSLSQKKEEPSKGEAHFVTKGLNSVWASLR